MKTKKEKDKIKSSGYIDNSCFEDYLSDLELLTNQKLIEQENELKKLSKKIKSLIELKFNGNRNEAIKFYKLKSDSI